MGICESAHHGKNLDKTVVRKISKEINKKDQTIEYQNIDNEEIEVGPSSSIQTDNNNKNNNTNTIDEENKENKKPELVQYDREYSCYNNKTNKTSYISSGKSEEEIIIRGEINKEAKNREEDFANNSFKKLIKKNGGIIIKNEDMNSALPESQTTNSLFDFGKETISEIRPKMDNNTQGIISGKYNINGKLIPNGNFHVKKNDIYNDGKKDKSSNNLNGINLNKLRESNRVNISLHESCPRVDSFLYIPKIDLPPPDMDELSEKFLQNSLISGK